MRICLFTPNFLPTVGGAERMADVLVRALIDRGHDVHVLCQQQKAGPADVPYPVHLYRRPPAMHLWPGSIGRALRKLHRDWPFDVVLAFYAYPTGYAATRIKAQLGVPVVISTRGGDLYPTSHLHKKPGVLRAIRAGYRGADRIISLGHWMTQRLAEVVGDGLPPITAIPNGIDLDEHDRQLTAAADHRPAFMDDDGPFALHLATLTPVKRHVVAVEAVAAARAAFEAHNARYIIAGDGQSADEIQQRITELAVGDLVQMVGSVSGHDKYWLLAHAAFGVSTSIAEGMPNVLLESMATGLPVLVSDIGPHTDLLEPAPWGRSFKQDDTAELAGAMEAMLTNELQPMRDAALELRSSFGLEDMIDQYEHVLKDVTTTPND